MPQFSKKLLQFDILEEFLTVYQAGGSVAIADAASSNDANDAADGDIELYRWMSRSWLKVVDIALVLKCAIFCCYILVNTNKLSL